MAERDIVDRLIDKVQYKRRVQQVQCQKRWSGKCLNGDCLAFQNMNGNYYRVKCGLP